MDTGHHIEAITIAIANKTTVAGGVAAVVTGAAERAGVVEVVNSSGTLDVAGMCAVGGLLLALCGYLTSLYFQIRRDKREAAEFKRREKRIG